MSITPAILKDYMELRRFWKTDALSYCKHRLGMNPTHQQRDIIEAIAEPGAKVTVRSGHGIGKVLTYETIVYTPKGKVKWEDVKVGDLLFGKDGSPTRVISRFDHVGKPFYRVTFDDGSSAEACAEHQWAVRGRQERRRGVEGYRVLTTEQILEIGVKRPNGSSLARQWEIPTQGPAQFEAREIDLHPYLVGVWIGDGCKATPQYVKPFDEVADKIRSFGYEVHDHSDGWAKRIQNVSHLFKDGVFLCGSHERYVPDDYKFNTVENRMALFEGLMDTDGEVHSSGSIGYSTTSEQLANDVIWLARSLGCKAMMQPTVKNTFYNGPEGERVGCKDCYRVTINAPFNPFTIKHRKERYKPSEDRYTARWIDSIEYIGPVDGMCVEVEAVDHLYLANDFIVTHNSAAMAGIAYWLLECFDKPRIPATAPTSHQLRDVLFAELAKWRSVSDELSAVRGLPKELFIGNLFKITQDRMYAVNQQNECFMVARTARPESPDALQGFHASNLRISDDGFSILEEGEGGELLFMIEEASGVDDKIFEVAEGALSSPKSRLLMVGNPTLSTGYFARSHKESRGLYKSLHFKSSDSPLADPAYRDNLVRKFGAGSNVVRVRADGEFPLQDDDVLISLELTEAALNRELRPGQTHLPKILGVDVARFGDDRTVFLLRQGKNILEIAIRERQDTMATAGDAFNYARLWGAEFVNIDETGLGAGVVDRMKEVIKDKEIKTLFVHGVNVAEKAPDRSSFDNIDAPPFRMRDHLWMEVANFFRDEKPSFANAPRDYAEDLVGELSSVKYIVDSSGRLVIESKDQMKKRGLRSPDLADALCCTFAVNLAAVWSRLAN